MLHPERDRLAVEIPSWGEQPHDDMGYTSERRRFGFYRRNKVRPDWAAVEVRDLEADQVPEFVADVRDYYGACDTAIVLRGDLDPAITQALNLAGCRGPETDVFLAHVGELPEIAAPDGVTVEPVAAEGLREWARTRIMAFENSEDEPDEARVDREVALREAEVADEGRTLMLRCHGEPAAICAYYEGRDRFIFLVGTRVPFRGRGLASVLLSRVVADARTAGCSSVIINADEDGAPARLYRKLGFTDTVHKQHVFRLPAGA